jgi:hypothetical protein
MIHHAIGMCRTHDSSSSRNRARSAATPIESRNWPLIVNEVAVRVDARTRLCAACVLRMPAFLSPRASISANLWPHLSRE